MKLDVKFQETNNSFKVKFGEHHIIQKGEEETSTYILVDENGNEVVAVLVDKETVFDATDNDIRKGKTAATEKGVTVGTKVIPAYHTNRGTQAVMPGSKVTITQLRENDVYDYTKLQAVICLFNTSMSNSVSAEMVSIDDSVYPVRSVEAMATVNKNHDTKAIEFGITNTFGKPCIVRYFTYKEIE